LRRRLPLDHHSYHHPVLLLRLRREQWLRLRQRLRLLNFLKISQVKKRERRKALPFSFSRKCKHFLE
jgi:VanZ family protein